MYKIRIYINIYLDRKEYFLIENSCKVNFTNQDENKTIYKTMYTKKYCIYY